MSRVTFSLDLDTKQADKLRICLLDRIVRLRTLSLQTKMEDDTRQHLREELSALHSILEEVTGID